LWHGGARAGAAGAPGALPGVLDHRPSVEEAFAWCERVARGHYENFTVGSFLLPKRLRRHFFSVYGFARGVDDLGDEATGDRLALLDAWEEELRRCYGGAPEHPVFVALQDTIGRFDLPSEPFLRLIEANRMDQTRTRHPTYADLLYYCDRSANPVGHLVLALFGYTDAERKHLADQICTGLQLVNFWQDVAVDAAKGRIYLPLEDLAQFGVPEAEILAGTFSERFRELMRFEVARTRVLFGEGRGLLPRVDRRFRFDLKLFSSGGLAILDAIERQGYDTLARRPALGKRDKARLMLGAFL
jgi:squalene synthase HpnC